MLYIVGTIREEEKSFVVLEEVNDNFEPTGNKFVENLVLLNNGFLKVNEKGQLILDAEIDTPANTQTGQQQRKKKRVK